MESFTFIYAHFRVLFSNSVILYILFKPTASTFEVQLKGNESSLIINRGTNVITTITTGHGLQLAYKVAGFPSAMKHHVNGFQCPPQPFLQWSADIVYCIPYSDNFSRYNIFVIQAQRTLREINS